MGLLEKLLDGTQGKNLYQGGNFGGATPATRAGALPTSQLHSQGTNTEDLNPTTTNQASATNLNFKTKVGQSKFDLDGQLPPTGTYRDNSPEGRNF